MATGISRPSAMPSAWHQQHHSFRGGVQYNPYTSPPHSGPATPADISPTQVPNHLALHTRQLRKPKSPLYIPAALRPTERPQRSSPPRSSVLSSPTDESIDGSRRGTVDSFSTSYSEIDRISTDEGIILGPVTGPPSRNHWKSNEETVKCNFKGCSRPFSLLCRRHHCRRCGDIFCYEHSSHEINLDQDALFHPDGTPSRACDNCWSAYRQWEHTRKSRSSSASSQSDSSMGTTAQTGHAEPQGLQLPQPRGSSVAQAPSFKVGSYVGSVPRDWNWSTF
ncbi:hypothetical protein IWX90DRAFT_482823 [Phyllosticta citrichinensis]|uniref:FYVE-type domain-containing protein n=1 Tax=Phyllosticta citrichinensis TaxID=1130410 RepID=A0ABR1Y7S7_9PEZI